MRSTVFNDKVAVALRDWHDTARKHTRHGHSDGVSPQSSRPSTPSNGMSPVHLLQSYDNNTPDMSPVASNYDNERWYGEGSGSLGKKDDDEQRPENFESREPGRGTQDSSSAQLALGPLPIQTQHEVNITSSEFSFRRSPRSPRPWLRWCEGWLIEDKTPRIDLVFCFSFLQFVFCMYICYTCNSIYVSSIQRLSKVVFVFLLNSK